MFIICNTFDLIRTLMTLSPIGVNAVVGNTITVLFLCLTCGLANLRGLAYQFDNLKHS